MNTALYSPQSHHRIYNRRWCSQDTFKEPGQLKGISSMAYYEITFFSPFQTVAISMLKVMNGLPQTLN